MLNQVPHEERGIAHAEHGEDRIVERGGAHRVAEGDVAEHGGGPREGVWVPLLYANIGNSRDAVSP